MKALVLVLAAFVGGAVVASVKAEANREDELCARFKRTGLVRLQWADKQEAASRAGTPERARWEATSESLRYLGSVVCNDAFLDSIVVPARR